MPAAPTGDIVITADELKSEWDDSIRHPLWHFAPESRKAVLHERRRRFGVYEID